MTDSIGTPTPSKITTIERHILEAERRHPEATGVLTNLLYDIALAGKVISSQITRAGLAPILGLAGEINIQGEAVMKLDKLADKIIQNMNDHTGRVAVMASEENPNIITISKKYRAGKYVLLFDPLDGSSNIDYNVSTGTIFTIYHRKTEKGPGTLEDCLQPGRDLVASVYILYGSSTMLVYSTGQGVHGFTLEPTIGEFLLSHPNIRIPAQAKYYSVNQSYESSWSEEIRQYTQYLQGLDGVPKGLSMRYIGSLISDFHRNLLSGGIFYYPANRETPEGKLRLLYEAVPLAFIAEQAGGYASDGRQNILGIQPTHLHQRTPLFIGNRDLVESAEAFIRGLGH